MQYAESHPELFLDAIPQLCDFPYSRLILCLLPEDDFIGYGTTTLATLPAFFPGYAYSLRMIFFWL